MTFLEWNSIREGTAKNYNDALQMFNDWMRSNNLKAETVSELDSVACEYLEHQYFLGFNHDVGDKLLAAFVYGSLTISTLGRAALPRMQRCLRSYRRLAPGSSRAPLPYLGLMAMVGTAYALNQPMFGLALLIQFSCYLRPHELLALKRRQLVPPASQTPLVWGLLLAPEGHGERSKTQQFDESVLVDWVHLPSFAQALRKLWATKHDDERLWRFEHQEFNQTFVRVAEVSGVATLNPHPYSLRHGGASHDVLTNRRSLDSVKLRGRWRAEASVRRYLKHARAMREESRLPAATSAYAKVIEKNLDVLLAGKFAAPSPPRLSQPSLASRKRARGS